MSEKTEAGALAIIANLKAKTGQDLDAWLAHLKTINPTDKKAAVAWLKAQGLGHFQAQVIAKRHEQSRS